MSEPPWEIDAVQKEIGDRATSNTMARLILADGRSYDMPQTQGTFGEAIVNLRKLFAVLKTVLLDPALFSVANCESKLTYIDGDTGVLLYSGYPIEQIVGNESTHLEVAQLLLNGELPTIAEDSAFRLKIAQRMPVHSQLQRISDVNHVDEEPLMAMAGLVSKLATPKICALDPNDPKSDAGLHLIAKAPTLAAMAYRHHVGVSGGYVNPSPYLGYAANFLTMCFRDSWVHGIPWKLTDVAERAMEQIFILHADHEQNASTATVRLSGSTGNTPFAAVVAGIMSLSGPAHGGANEAVMHQLSELLKNNKGDVEKAADEAIALAKTPTKDGGTRLMGFGHRVYKNRDPRATALKGICAELLNALGIESNLFKFAQRLEQIAATDPHFVEKKLYPNVDFYSGIILNALGFPASMFTPIFAVGRMTGWVAQYQEMLKAGPVQIGRPRQGYVGPSKRDFIPKELRGWAVGSPTKAMPATAEGPI